MKIVLGGPSITELKRKLGTDEAVQFGTGDDTVNVKPDLLASVGCADDLPVEVPRRITQDDSAWLISGNSIDDDDFPRVMIIYSFLGRTRCAAIVYEGHPLSGDLYPHAMLSKMFAQRMQKELDTELSED